MNVITKETVSSIVTPIYNKIENISPRSLDGFLDSVFCGIQEAIGTDGGVADIWYTGTNIDTLIDLWESYDIYGLIEHFWDYAQTEHSYMEL